MKFQTYTVFAIISLFFIIAVDSQPSEPTLPPLGQPTMPSFSTSCGNSSSLENVFMYGHYCSSILTDWYRNEIDPYAYGRPPGSRLQFQNTTQHWDEICRWSWNVARCYESILPDCNPGIGLELLNNPKFFLSQIPTRPCYEGPQSFYGIPNKLLGFYRKTCSGQTLKTDIRTRIEDSTLDANSTCVSTDIQKELSQCSRHFYGEPFDTKSYIQSSAVRQTLNKAAEAMVNCMYSVINRSPCNAATKRMLYHVATLQLPSFIDEGELSLDQSTTMDFSSLLRCTIGVYGDPHLRMCFEPGQTTCSAEGPQLLIANGWFIVAGEHKTIGHPGNPPATSLRSIQLQFYSLDSTQLVAKYTAADGSLPIVFDDGSTVAGAGDDVVTITNDGYQVEFVQQSTGMILKLRQWSGNYFFTLRVAQGVIRKSYGLLATGCPTEQIIARSTWSWFSRFTRRKRAVTRESCETACNSTFTDETLSSICAFDCFVTDDVEFGLNMTSSAEVDIVEIEKRDEEIRAGALNLTEKPGNAASSTLPTHSLIISSIVCVITAFIHTLTQ